MCIDGMGMTDLAVDRLIPAPSQWPEFYDWAHAAFDLSDDSWVPAGGVLRIFGQTILDDRWNGIKPYGKMIHAIYLLAFALRDDYIPQWHARLDYLSASMSADNNYQGRFTPGSSAVEMQVRPLRLDASRPGIGRITNVRFLTLVATAMIRRSEHLPSFMRAGITGSTSTDGTVLT